MSFHRNGCLSLRAEQLQRKCCWLPCPLVLHLWMQRALSGMKEWSHVFSTAFRVVGWSIVPYPKASKGALSDSRKKGVGNETQRSCFFENGVITFWKCIQEINQETVQVFPGLNCHLFIEVFAGKRAQGCPLHCSIFLLRSHFKDFSPKGHSLPETPLDPG